MAGKKNSLITKTTDNKIIINAPSNIKIQVFQNGSFHIHTKDELIFQEPSGLMKIKIRNSKREIILVNDFKLQTFEMNSSSPKTSQNQILIKKRTRGNTPLNRLNNNQIKSNGNMFDKMLEKALEKVNLLFLEKLN